MMKYAFIDVQNTASTAQKMLNFVIDWSKLCKHLKENWECEKVFLYSGIEIGDEKTANEFSNLNNDLGCIVKVKTVIAYKNPDLTISHKCPKCNEESIKVIDMGYRKNPIATLNLLQMP